MTRKSLLTLAGAAGLLLAAGIWINTHRAAQQTAGSGGVLFEDMKPALGDISEIRLSRGDGSRTTLRRGAGGWTVVERNYPADASRVREVALALAGMKVIERKTSDPANYAKLGVEAPDSPTATSTLVEVVAGPKTWSLIVGKGTGGREVYVRKPADAASALAEPSVTVDPDQKRWIDRLLVDLPGADVHDIDVQPAGGPAYLLSRAKRGDADLALTPVPRGRTTVSSISLNGQADSLQGFHFDDVRALANPAPAATDHAVFRTFDGQVIEFAGRRAGEQAFITVAARRDLGLAARFPAPPAPAADKAAAPAAPLAPNPAPNPAPKPAAQTVERLAPRVAGVEFEIPAYKYDALFKAQEELLEKPPEKPAKKSAK